MDLLKVKEVQVKMILRNFTWVPILLFSVMNSHAQPQKFFGGIWQNWNPLNPHPASFTKLFNQVTPENSGKWAKCETSRGVYDWNSLDAMYAWSDSTGFPVKQHAFVWYQSAPTWLTSYTNEDTVKAIVKNWITTYLKRYGNKIDMIDVVNEPLEPLPSFANALGGNGTTGWDWVIWTFRTTRELCRIYAPNAKLLINDYSVIKNDGKTTRYLGLIKLLNDQKLIDGIGEQGHFYETEDTAVLHRNLNRLVATGLPVYISELDVNISNDQEQLTAYKRLFPLFWDHPGVKGITMWGYMSGQIWRTQASLIRADGSERPALTWLKDYMSKSSVGISNNNQKSKAHSKTHNSRLTFGHGIEQQWTPMISHKTGNAVQLYKMSGSKIGESGNIKP